MSRRRGWRRAGPHRRTRSRRIARRRPNCSRSIRSPPPPSGTRRGSARIRCSAEGPRPTPFAAPLAQAAVALPADFDPLAPDPAERAFRGPTQSDHSPHLEDAFSPPVSKTVLPDDWDREKSQPGVARLRPPEPAPVPVPPVASAPAAAPVLVSFDPAPELAPSEAVTTSVTAPPRRAPAPIAAAQAEAPAAPASNDLLAAFLRGCGCDDLRPADPAAMMEALGAAFRAVVSGLRQAMIARSAIKGEFRIEQTMIRSRGNNPLKFSADDDDALAALLGVGRRAGPPARRGDQRGVARHPAA